MIGSTNYGELILDLPDSHKNIARYMWTVFTKATRFRFSDLPVTPFVIDSTGGFAITNSFHDFLSGNIDTVAARYNLPSGLKDFRNAEPLACAFYLLNSLHETILPAHKLDHYGRYPYQESIQNTHNLMEVNYVQEILDDMYVNLTGQPTVETESKIMWSHDIDYLFSAWRNDLIVALRDSRYWEIPKIMWKAATTSSRWDNIDDILKMENEYGIHSIFFWLTQRGKSRVSPTHSIDHADYTFQMKKLQKYWQRIAKSGAIHGLHKSTFPIEMEAELQRLPEPVEINRNHFLRFSLPNHYDHVERSGLKYDATLGFPEQFGFRNSFGSPFQPYNLRKNRPYRFIEYPLHLMDATFLTYLNDDLESMTQKMIDFVQRHDRSCTIGILLHNTYFDFRNMEQMQIWNRFFQSMRGLNSVLPGE